MSSTPGTPAVSASPTKNEEGTPAKPVFSEKEENLLKVIMSSCLKSGPPEIDMKKFMKHGNFNTLKTAQNTWGKIKAKLVAAAGDKDEDDAGEGAENENGPGTPKTPKTPATTTPASKKRGKKAEGDAEGDMNGDGSPKKKQRKSPVKKTPKKVKAEANHEEGVVPEVKMEEGPDE